MVIVRDSAFSFLFAIRSFLQLYRTGTRKYDVVSSNIPPKMGMDIGIIISLPFPVEVNTGTNAKIVVTVVIKQGRILLEAASNVDCLISALSVGSFLSKVCVR